MQEEHGCLGTAMCLSSFYCMLGQNLGADSSTIVSSKYVNCVEIVDGWRPTVFKLHLRGGELFRLDLGNAAELA